MNERERILDLVKKGVLSTEEALDLLEGIAGRKSTHRRLMMRMNYIVFEVANFYFLHGV